MPSYALNQAADDPLSILSTEMLNRDLTRARRELSLIIESLQIDLDRLVDAKREIDAVKAELGRRGQEVCHG